MKWVRCFLTIFVFAISPLWGQTKFVKVYRVSDSLIPAGVVPYPDRYVVVAGKKDNSPASIADTVFILTFDLSGNLQRVNKIWLIESWTTEHVFSPRMVAVHPNYPNYIFASGYYYNGMTSSSQGVFLMKFDTSLSDILIYLTKVIGISEFDGGFIKYHSKKNIFILGGIRGDVFETNPFITTAGFSGFVSGQLLLFGYGDAYFVRSMDEMPDSGMILITGYSDGYIHRLNSSYNLLWSKEVSISPFDVKVFGNYIYLLLYTGSSGYDIVLAKMDVNGNLLWAKKYDGGVADRPVSLKISPDNNLLISGYTASVSGTTSDPDIFLMKVDTGGNIIWSKAYPLQYRQVSGSYDGGGYYDMFRTIWGPNHLLVLNDGYLIVGSDSLSNIILIKTDLNGDAGYCTTNFSLSVSNYSLSITNPSVSTSSVSFSAETPLFDNSPGSYTNINRLCRSSSVSEKSCENTPFVVLRGEIRFKEDVNYAIYDVRGLEVMRGRGRTVSLKAGIYFVRVNGEVYKVLIRG